ncbi:GlxA family transcriptional regulator [Qipengyuania qiaonensis]|uniref:DJ-1/PfpI family protein n=1 Tax=Qipengyuania qiaonensis TaxID=2867240 RepID=A0ABS7J498_9SPHN|nr:DJ-1/PfpI family protein [Qipengyuania qiaonensis]MBX7482154.1 DJ-1/PfpI family protein [Qipengyuania qiaonensis]
MTRRVVILAYKGAQILDITGPAAVLAEANHLLPAPGYGVILASAAGGMIRTGGGIAVETVKAEHIVAGDIDTAIIPGADANSLADALRDRQLAAAIRSLAGARRVASVCTGAFLLAQNGLLSGRNATTHWEAGEELLRRFPDVMVDSDALFIVDGPVWTSAGVSTGIDMTLAMVENDHDRALAARVARRLVLQMRRDGNQSQFSETLAAQGGEFADLITWMQDNLGEDLSVGQLARRTALSERTFYRRFSQATGHRPATFVRRLRVERARALLEAGVPSKKVASQSGFGSVDLLRRAYRAIFARDLPRPGAD